MKSGPKSRRKRYPGWKPNFMLLGKKKKLQKPRMKMETRLARSPPLSFYQLFTDSITVKHQRFSEQEGYRSQLLELRKRRKEVESLLKSKEGEQIWNSSCSPAEFPSTSSGSSVQIQESESDGQQQIEHGHRQPPGAYWDDL